MATVAILPVKNGAEAVNETGKRLVFLANSCKRDSCHCGVATMLAWCAETGHEVRNLRTIALILTEHHDNAT